MNSSITKKTLKAATLNVDSNCNVPLTYQSNAKITAILLFIVTVNYFTEQSCDKTLPCIKH
jgi:hypothetical protein